jgi:hypothetical protein
MSEEFSQAVCFAQRQLWSHAPAGSIFNLDTVQTTPLTSYQPFSTSFVADNTSEFVSFAFRETLKMVRIR